MLILRVLMLFLACGIIGSSANGVNSPGRLFKYLSKAVIAENYSGAAKTIYRLEHQKICEKPKYAAQCWSSTVNLIKTLDTRKNALWLCAKSAITMREVLSGFYVQTYIKMVADIVNSENNVDFCIQAIASLKLFDGKGLDEWHEQIRGLLRNIATNHDETITKKLDEKITKKANEVLRVFEYKPVNGQFKQHVARQGL